MPRVLVVLLVVVVEDVEQTTTDRHTDKCVFRQFHQSDWVNICIYSYLARYISLASLPLEWKSPPPEQKPQLNCSMHASLAWHT